MSGWVTASTSSTRAAMDDMARRVDRANMWALREAARQVKRSAAKRARVYQGDRVDVPRGRLKKSIGSSKRFTRAANGSRSLKVSPKTWPAVGYAAKIEQREPFMRPAYDEAAPLLEAICQRAYKRAMERG